MRNPWTLPAIQNETVSKYQTWGRTVTIQPGGVERVATVDIGQPGAWQWLVYVAGGDTDAIELTVTFGTQTSSLVQTAHIIRTVANGIGVGNCVYLDARNTSGAAAQITASIAPLSGSWPEVLRPEAAGYLGDQATAPKTQLPAQWRKGGFLQIPATNTGAVYLYLTTVPSTGPTGRMPVIAIPPPSLTQSAMPVPLPDTYQGPLCLIVPTVGDSAVLSVW